MRFPSFSVANSVDLGIAHSIGFGYGLSWKSSIKQIANLEIFNFRQLCHAVLFARQACASTLIRAILHIVSLRSEKKMVVIAARGVVTGVANLSAVYLHAGEVSSYTVRENLDPFSITLSCQREYAVPVLVKATSPWPAIVWATLIDLFPKGNFLFFGNVHGEFIISPSALSKKQISARAGVIPRNPKPGSTGVSGSSTE